MKTTILFVVLALLFLGCIGENYTSIKDIKEDPGTYLGEKVLVTGTVKDSFKLGQLSGFTLEGDNETIFVSSSMLPVEGTEVVVEGTVMQEIIVGYYILAKDVTTT
ncbi:hypothetical protein KKB44_00830 [Candidatus Micrarchaeota archaeon]|nr:hypothetical protein [Candidatus Micrarchaeota archaeon]